MPKHFHRQHGDMKSQPLGTQRKESVRRLCLEGQGGWRGQAANRVAGATGEGRRGHGDRNSMGQKSAEIKTFSSSKHELGREEWTFGGLGDTEVSQMGTGCRDRRKSSCSSDAPQNRKGGGAALVGEDVQTPVHTHSRTRAPAGALRQVSELQVQPRALTVGSHAPHVGFSRGGRQAGAAGMPLTPWGQASRLSTEACLSHLAARDPSRLLGQGSGPVLGSGPA